MARTPALALALSLACIAAMPAVHAMVEGRTSQGGAFVSGGIDVGERDALAARRAQASLRITTAARGSGAYLADVQMRIVARDGATVLDTTLDGPWLLVDLAPGDYRVQAVEGTQSLERQVRIRAGAAREIVFYFEAPAESVPKGQEP